MTKDSFSGSCIDICGNISNSTDVDTIQACDVGSQSYCNDITNIGSDNCSVYLQRLIDTQIAPTTTGLIKVQVPFTTSIQTYFNNVVATADNYCTADKIINGNKLCKNDSSGLYINKILANKTDTDKDTKFNTYINYCKANNNVDIVKNFYSDSNSKLNPPTGIFSLPGFQTWLTKKIESAKSVYIVTTDVDISNISKFYTDSVFTGLYFLYPSRFIDIDNKFISLLSDSSLMNPSIFLGMNVSSIVTDGVYKYIAAQLSTRRDLNILLDALSVFITNALSANGLSSTNADTRFVSLRDLVNTSLTYLKSAGVCMTQSPFDPSCNVIYNNSTLTYNGINIQPNVKSVIDSKRSTYCLDPSKITTGNFAVCSSQINNISDEAGKTGVRNALTRYCINSNDTTNCNPYPKMFSTDADTTQWLKDKTKNTIDSNGAITTICGTNNNFTINECTNMCKKYPDICKNDTIAKCAKPMYRYNTSTAGTDTYKNKDTYLELEDEDTNEIEVEFEKNTYYPYMYYIILIIILLIVASLVERSDVIRRILNGNKPDSIYQEFSQKI